jgi:hypothetical protein
MRGRITLLAALLSVSCQRARVPIDGVWDRGGVSGDHFGNYYLVLESAGDEISGHACRTSEGHIIFRDVPVQGDYPWLHFSVAPGFRFVGRVTSEYTIAGTLGLVRGEGTPTTFHHSATEAPQGCFSEGSIAGVARHW